LLAAAVFSCWLSQTLPVQAEAVTSPKTCQIGVYLTSLRDFHPAEKSFSANFWVWSVCPFETPKPLESLKVVNSKKLAKITPLFPEAKICRIHLRQVKTYSGLKRRLAQLYITTGTQKIIHSIAMYCKFPLRKHC
jgi:hypothetical protein